MECEAITARLKEGSEQRAAELVGAGPPFDQSREGVDEQRRVARERFGWQLDVAAAGTARAGQRSESWA
jgi:hypothetical protein